MRDGAERRFVTVGVSLVHDELAASQDATPQRCMDDQTFLDLGLVGPATSTVAAVLSD